jgi:hypothetical protein
MLRVFDIIEKYAQMAGLDLPAHQIRLIEDELVGRLKLRWNDIEYACMHVAYSGGDFTLKNILFALPGAWPRPEEARAMLYYADNIPTLAADVADTYYAFGWNTEEAFLEKYERAVLGAWARGEVYAKWITRSEWAHRNNKIYREYLANRTYKHRG